MSKEQLLNVIVAFFIRFVIK